MTSISTATVKKLVFEKLKAQKQEGIKFAIAGNAGYGKTSTVNALFGVNMDTDPVFTTTKDVHSVSMHIFDDVKHRQSEIRDTTLTVYDLPGLGDGEDKDEKEIDNFEIYRELIKEVELDVLLWVLRADVRAFKLEVDYISKLLEEFPFMKSRIIVGLNFVDKVEPYETWIADINQPSDKQLETLARVKQRVDERIHKKCGLESRITVEYSSKKAWQLHQLFRALIEATPEHKKWVISELKLDYEKAFLAHVPEQFRQAVAASFRQQMAAAG